MSQGRRPSAKSTPTPRTKCPTDPPDWLSEYAREEWTRVHHELTEMGANISGLEFASLVCYCDSFGKVRNAIEILAREGDTVLDERGGTKKHPAHTILNTAKTALRQWAVELGLTPASKGKIPMAKSAERVSKFKAL